MRHLRILTLLTTATIAPVLLLTACSPTTPSSRAADAAEASKLPADDTGASSVEPEASGEPFAGTQRWPTQVACPQFSGRSRRIKVVNLTSVLLVLKAGDIDCFDWSGTANPALMTGFALSPGTSREFSFQINANAFPKWTMGLNHGVKALGDFRGELAGHTTSVMTVAGAGTQYDGPCQRVPVGADPARTASTTRPSRDFVTMWLWSDGSNLFAETCNTQGY